MTDLQQEHIQRDLDTVKVAARKLRTAATKALHAKQVKDDAERAYAEALRRLRHSANQEPTIDITSL